MRSNLRLPALALAVLAATLSGCGTSGPPAPPPGLTDMPTRSDAPPVFYVDTTSLVAEESSTGVRITVSAPLNQLPFTRRQGGGYEAEFEMSAIFYDRDGRQVTGDVWRYRTTAEHYRDTTSSRKSYTTNADFVLEPGEYTLIVRVSSVGGTGGSTATRLVYVSPLSTQGVQISAIEIGSCADSLAGVAGPDATAFTASLTRRFGDPLPHVCARGEVFARGAGPGEMMPITLETVDRGGQVHSTVLDTLFAVGARTAFLIPMPVESLGPGTYVLELTATYRGESSTSSREFEIDASRIDIERNYEDYVELVRYYLGDEADELRGAPPGERRARWDAFWKERDPDPGTPENERLDEFVSRIRVAAERFPERGKPGWDTDRGMVYIRYGEPEDIEQVPAGFNSPAYEIWRYTSRNLTFVFADTGGFGEYILVQPSSPF